MISVLIVRWMHPRSMGEDVYVVSPASDQVLGVVRRVPDVSLMQVDHVPPVRARAVVRRRFVSRMK